MKLTKQIKNQIREHALEESPRECCGFLVRDEEENLIAHKAKNSALRPNLFRCSPHDYLMAESKGKIVSVYHSHTNSNQFFSDFDKFNSVCHKVAYVLYCLNNNSFTQYCPKLSKFHKYIGRSFKIGETDCYSLVRDFYKFELNIEVNAPAYDKNWRSCLEDLFDKYFEREGFYKVNELQKYDCIFFSRRKGEPSHHCALYLGEGLILHQPGKSYSRVEEYASTHKKLTNYIVRHKDTWKT